MNLIGLKVALKIIHEGAAEAIAESRLLSGQGLASYHL
jgi:hypothetical protein